jgi:GNAT superfamily N-acetyltransferase
VPFYTAFYSGGEAVGILHSDKTVINAFHEANYQVHQATTWFHLDLQNYVPVITAETVGYYGEIEIEINEASQAKTWWEGCTLANGIWFDATASLSRTGRPIARLRTRITYPDTGNMLTMYERTWLASLIELRVHPSFDNKGIKKYLLDELLQYLAAQNQILQIEAHTVDHTPLFTLLRGQSWTERNRGSVFIKNV